MLNEDFSTSNASEPADVNGWTRRVDFVLAVGVLIGLLLAACGLFLSLSARRTAKMMVARVEGHIIRVGALGSDVRATVVGSRNRIATLGREISLVRGSITNLLQSGYTVGGQESSGAGATGDSDHVFHTVRAGDTLGAIAAKYGVGVADLQKLNPGLEATRLQVGRRIRIR